MVNLMTFRILIETNPWACLRERFWIGLIDLGRPTLNVGDTHRSTGWTPRVNKKEKQAEQQRSFLSAS